MFCGFFCVFINVKMFWVYISWKYEFFRIFVKCGVIIGVNVIIVCGNMFGEYCMIGFGLMVIKNVFFYVFWVGLFVCYFGWVFCCGVCMGDDFVCFELGEYYELDEMIGGLRFIG